MPAAGALPLANPQPPPSQASLTRSGLFDAPPAGEAQPEPNTDPSHVGRLFDGRHGQSPRPGRLSLDRVEYGRTNFAGMDARGAATKIVSRRRFIPTTARRARQTFAQALTAGEALGLIVRIRTAHGSTRAIEVNVGARYGIESESEPSSLSSHRRHRKGPAERALKLRTLELTQVNEQLRRINRELEEVKQSLARANDALRSGIASSTNSCTSSLTTFRNRCAP